MIEDAVRKYGPLILLGALFAQMVFSEGGVMGYIKIKRDIKAVNTSIAKLDKDNTLLMNEIERLQKDDQYLEDVVRKKFGFVREGEKVYRVEK